MAASEHAERVCKCGCGTPISPQRRSDAIWASEACAKRYRRGRALKALPPPPSPDKARTVAPAGLKDAGKALWESILGDLEEGWQFDARELHLLARACRCADDLAALEKAVDEDGPTAKGSRGQIVVHPALAEARHLRLVQLRLLEALELPDEGGSDG